MQWNSKPPKTGDKRKVTRFLFLPKTIKGVTRWLTHATWIEKYKDAAAPHNPNVYDGPCKYKWVPIKWKD